MTAPVRQLRRAPLGGALHSYGVRQPRPVEADPTSFGSVLRRYRVATGLSQNALAHAAGVDPAYVNRLERNGYGARWQPKRLIVTSIAAALSLDDRERDRLLYAAGLAPGVDWQTLAERYARQLRAITDALCDGERDDRVRP